MRLDLVGVERQRVLIGRLRRPRAVPRQLDLTGLEPGLGGDRIGIRDVLQMIQGFLRPALGLGHARAEHPVQRCRRDLRRPAIQDGTGLLEPPGVELGQSLAEQAETSRVHDRVRARHRL